MNRRRFLYTSSILFTGFSLFGCKSEKVDFGGIKIGYLPITDHLLIIAKEFGANFNPIKFASWADLSEALRAQAIDGAFILTPLALKLKSLNVPIKALLAAHRNGSALVVKKGLVKSGDINALKGKKIAIPSRFSTHYLLLATLLKSANLSLNDVELVDMSPTEMIFALQSNSIDGFIVAEPFNLKAQEADLADIFILSKDILNNHICCVLTINENIINERRSEVSALVGEFLKAATFIANKPDEAAQISQKYLGHEPNLIKNLLAQDERVIYKNLALQESDISRVLSDISEFKLDEFDISFDSFVDSSFIKEHQNENL